MKLKKTQKSGFAIIEAILGITIGGMITLFFLSTLKQAVKINHSNIDDWQAILYLHEGDEIARDLEISNWTAISTCANPGHPSVSGSVWTIQSGKEFLDRKFERSFKIEPVLRNAGGKITLSGGTIDPLMKKITTSVSWLKNSATTTESVELYIYKP